MDLRYNSKLSFKERVIYSSKSWLWTMIFYHRDTTLNNLLRLVLKKKEILIMSVLIMENTRNNEDNLATTLSKIAQIINLHRLINNG